MSTMSVEESDFWGLKDPRIAAYPLMDHPFKTFMFSAIYLSFVKVIGPALMKNRKPFELRAIMVVFNAFLVALSTWLCLSFGFNGWLTRYSWRCESINFSSTNPTDLNMVFTCWVFYVSKLFEFADTVFFVLRKKYAQMNFLHLFHHTLVPITSWYGVSYGPGGYNTIFPLLNTFVHIWMYLYYGLSALGPSVQKYLWWKKYLTSLQMMQFVGILVFYTQLYLFPKKDCKVYGFHVCISGIQAIIFLGLFLNFYFKSYKRIPLSKYHSVSKAYTQNDQNGFHGDESKHKQN